MNKLFVAGIAAASALCGAPALAADMPTKAPVYKAPPAVVVSTWTGCYIGGNVGGGWAEKHIVDVAEGLGDRDRHTSSGFVGGGQIGCDYQVNNWVFGVQGLFDGADITGTHFDFANPANLTWHSKNSWFGTLTGRIGYTIQPMALLYAKVGGAWVRDHNLLILFGGPGTQSTPDTTMTGWTVGTGVEYKFAPDWSVFAEYNYIGLATKGNEPFFDSLAVKSFPYDVHNNLQTVLVGVNYRFGSR
jgi:outer membrane immunogenic protein